MDILSIIVMALSLVGSLAVIYGLIREYFVTKTRAGYRAGGESTARKDHGKVKHIDGSNG